MSVESVAAEVVRFTELLIGDDVMSREQDAIVITHGQSDQMKRIFTDNPQDPWRAQWKGHCGTGATCEMALIELKESLRKEFAGMIEREEERATRAINRAQALREAVAVRQSSNTNPEKRDP